ncbi:hypothetical protein I7I51_02534 [Histoplasma capsulatum]|uniref:Uncharacterized protein n=1 Tax=Ajellomyces capsulatus TaxID=5037 RepID=A0A8A1MDV6_AJECA|nr:hypothetical protein I7I51_02534 [Histoplasma capsulatum]
MYCGIARYIVFHFAPQEASIEISNWKIETSKTRRDLEQKIEVESAISGFNYCPSLDPQSSLKLPYTAHVRAELYEPSKDPEQSQGKLRWDEPNMVNHAKCPLGPTLEDLLVAIMEYQSRLECWCPRWIFPRVAWPSKFGTFEDLKVSTFRISKPRKGPLENPFIFLEFHKLIKRHYDGGQTLILTHSTPKLNPFHWMHGQPTLYIVVCSASQNGQTKRRARCLPGSQIFSTLLTFHTYPFGPHVAADYTSLVLISGTSTPSSLVLTRLPERTILASCPIGKSPGLGPGPLAAPVFIHVRHFGGVHDNCRDQRSTNHDEINTRSVNSNISLRMLEISRKSQCWSSNKSGAHSISDGLLVPDLLGLRNQAPVTSFAI